jgi:hypothetical protein
MKLSKIFEVCLKDILKGLRSLRWYFTKPWKPT